MNAEKETGENGGEHKVSREFYSPPLPKFLQVFQHN